MEKLRAGRWYRSSRVLGVPIKSFSNQIVKFDDFDLEFDFINQVLVKRVGVASIGIGSIVGKGSRISSFKGSIHGNSFGIRVDFNWFLGRVLGIPTFEVVDRFGNSVLSYTIPISSDSFRLGRILDATYDDQGEILTGVCKPDEVEMASVLMALILSYRIACANSG
jgi:hypothetical protein